jgi:hypothetical protein
MVREASALNNSNFDLNNVSVELVPASRLPERRSVSMQELEALRTERRPVTASKHGLETICGASCETGAQ